MIVLHDFRLSLRAVTILKDYGEPIAFNSQHILGDSPLRGHPDIFCCLGLAMPIFAPNTPQYIIDKLKLENIDFRFGKTIISHKKECVSAYNVAVSQSFVIHNKRFTDAVIMENLQEKEYIHVNQSFSRCSTMVLPKDNFITSDKGICSKLEKLYINCLYVNPEQIILTGFNYGLIGGCMGFDGKHVFICGSLKYFSEGNKVGNWITNLGWDIVELDDTPLFDGGGLLFLDK